MAFIYYFISIFLITIYLKIVLKEDFYKLFVFTQLILVLISYFMGLIGLLVHFKITYIALLVIVTFKLAISYKISFQTFKEIALNLKFIVFVLIIGITIFINQNRFLLIWDEFSHWGLASKLLIENTSFNWSGTVIEGTIYPPALALLHFISSIFSPIFSEENLFLGGALLTISIVFSYLKSFKLKESAGQLSLLFIIFYILSRNFQYFLSTVYVDVYVSLLFALSISRVIEFKGKIFHFIEILIYVSLLILLKNVGFQFSLIVLAIFILNQFLCYKRINIKFIIFTTVLLFVILFINKSWYQYSINTISASVASNVSVINYSLTNIISIFTKQNLSSDQILTIKNFSDYFFSRSSFEFQLLSYFFISLITMLVVFMIELKHQLNLSKFYQFLLLNLGYYAYAFYLLLFYLFSFNEFKNGRVDSIDRYLGIFNVTILIVFIGIMQNNQYINRKKLSITIFLMALLISHSLFTNIKQHYESTQYSIYVRNAYVKLIEFKQTLKESDKVFFIAQNTNGYDYWVARYLFSPNQINVGYSFGFKYYDNDIYTQFLTIEEISNLIKNYEYVFTYIVDEHFMSYYHWIFSEPSMVDNNQGFEVIQYNDGENIVLVKIFN